MNSLRNLLCVIIAFNAFCPSEATQKQNIQLPQISFVYDWKSVVVDFIGMFLFKKVTKQYKQELNNQLPDLIKAWEHSSYLFFNEIFSSFGRGFKNSKRTASLYLSHNASYGSNRFLFLGLRYYVDSEEWSGQLSKQDCFCNLVFHELLHIWVEDNVDINSPLRKKYCKESADVLDHLHLMALQKMVYLKLNRNDMIDHINDAYRNLATKDYKRAWEIVNDIEGYELVLKDIIDNLCCDSIK